MGHRNEPARERRRQVLKQQLSLRSIPLVEPPLEKYNLDNHFGWKVLQKCRVGDGSFPPYLLHCIYCDKPDMSAYDAGDHDKVTYVLYIRGKDGEAEPVDVKETQTVFSAISVAPILMTGPPPEPEKKRGKVRMPPPRRKIISDFYYIPIKARIDDKYNIRTVSKVPSGNNVDNSRGDVSESSKGKGKKPKKGKGRTKPKSWQLRAGAESPEENEEVGEVEGGTSGTDFSSESEDDHQEEETRSTLIDNLKRYTRIPPVGDCTNCCGKTPANEELMVSSLDKNKYLYIRGERYEKRPASARTPSPTAKCVGIGDQPADQ